MAQFLLCLRSAKITKITIMSMGMGMGMGMGMIAVGTEVNIMTGIATGIGGKSMLPNNTIPLSMLLIL